MSKKKTVTEEQAVKAAIDNGTLPEAQAVRQAGRDQRQKHLKKYITEFNSLLTQAIEHGVDYVVVNVEKGHAATFASALKARNYFVEVAEGEGETKLKFTISWVIQS